MKATKLADYNDAIKRFRGVSFFRSLTPVSTIYDACGKSGDVSFRPVADIYKNKSCYGFYLELILS